MSSYILDFQCIKDLNSCTEYHLQKQEEQIHIDQDFILA